MAKGLTLIDGSDTSVDSSKSHEDLLKLKRLLDHIDRRAVAHTRQWLPLFEDGRNYVFGNQLAGVDVPEGWSRFQDNKLFPAAIQEQALLSQRRVTVKTLPFEEGDTKGAEAWSPILQWQYEKGLNVPRLVLLGIDDAKTHGHWIVRLEWEPEARWDAKEQKWTGEVRAVAVRPEYLVIDPDSSDPDNPEWVVEYEPMRWDEARRRWPTLKKAEKEGELPKPLGDDAGWFQRRIAQFRRTWRRVTHQIDKPDPGTEPGTEGRLAALLTPQLHDEDDLETEGHDDNDRKVWVARYFLKDRTRKRIRHVEREYTDDEMIAAGLAMPEEAPAPGKAEGEAVFTLPKLISTKTGEPVTLEERQVARPVDQPAYTPYRHIVRVEEYLALDEPWGYAEPPYAIGHNLPLPHTWHGLNAVEIPKHLQDFLNRTGRSFANYVENFAAPIVLVEEGAVADCPDLEGVEDKLSTAPGAVWKLTPHALSAGKIRREPAMALGGGLFNICQHYNNELQDQTGVHEIAMGRRTTGDTTATEALSLDTYTRLRTALQWLLSEEFIDRLMRRVQAICQREMTPGQMLRIAGEKLATAMVELTQEALDARFDLHFEVVTDLPFDRERRKTEAKELYAIFRDAVAELVLDAYEVPDKEEILAKLPAYQLAEELQTRMPELLQLLETYRAARGQGEAPNAPAATPGRREPAAAGPAA